MRYTAGTYVIKGTLDSIIGNLANFWGRQELRKSLSCSTQLRLPELSVTCIFTTLRVFAPEEDCGEDNGCQEAAHRR